MPLTDKQIDPQIEVYRELAPWQRLAAASQLYFFAREIIKNRIKRQFPNITPEELEKKIRTYF